ncbi:hypothetical protein LEP1GSC072_2468 [Leptospira noguchii str. Bonito]|nr:hypothetical protein LEP1GSC072_2468 [Leptospira noguchii str. Bonito]
MHVARCNSYRSFVGTQSLFLGKILALKMSSANRSETQKCGTTSFCDLINASRA